MVDALAGSYLFEVDGSYLSFSSPFYAMIGSNTLPVGGPSWFFVEVSWFLVYL